MIHKVNSSSPPTNVDASFTAPAKSSDPDEMSLSAISARRQVGPRSDLALRLNSIPPTDEAASFGLSDSKRAFLQRFSPERRGWPCVQQYEQLGCDLEQKHKVRILINGDGTMLKASRERWLAERMAILSSDYAYASVRNTVCSKYLFGQEGLAFRNQFRKYIDFGNPSGIKAGSEVEFSMDIKQHPKYVELFEKAIAEAKANAARESMDTGLDTPDAATDIALNAVPSAVRQQRPIGYMRPAYESGRGIGAGTGHFDTFIALPSGLVINPVNYKCLDSYENLTCELKEKHGVEVVSTDMSAVVGKNSEAIHPQADAISCGSLGLGYLKEYLKEGGAQMRDYCLIVDGIQSSTDSEPSSFLLPSPQVLRYSQSGRFNSVIREMVDPEPSFKSINGWSNTLEVPTLAKLLAEGAIISTVDGDPVTTEELDVFCKRWRDAYQTSNVKRDAMTTSVPAKDGTTVSSVNAYLAHVQDRHYRRNERADRNANRVPDDGPQGLNFNNFIACVNDCRLVQYSAHGSCV